MVKPVKTYVSTLLLSILTVMSSHALAIECYAPSPNLVALADDYYGLEKPEPLSYADNNKINALFRAIAGNWKGDMQHFECRGPDRAPRIISHTATVTAKAKLTSEMGLAINAEKNNLKSRTKRPEHFTLIGNTPTFDLRFINDNHVVFAERYRRLNQVGKKEKPNAQQNKPAKQKTSRITETIVEIELHSGALHFVRSYYTNGVYIGEEHWQMQRD